MTDEMRLAEGSDPAGRWREAAFHGRGRGAPTAWFPGLASRTHPVAAAGHPRLDVSSQNLARGGSRRSGRFFARSRA
jgi:hypothetical protein